MISDLFLIFLGMLIGAFIGVYSAFLCVLHIEGMEAWVRSRRRKRHETAQTKAEKKTGVESDAEAETTADIDTATSELADADDICNASRAASVATEDGEDKKETDKTEAPKEALKAACGVTFDPKIDGKDDGAIKEKMKGQDGHYCFLSGKRTEADTSGGTGEKD